MAAYNFPNSPSDGDTVTSNGITYTYSSSKTRWDGAAASGSSTTVYATIDLLPLSGASTGDQAYVSGNNRLYIWNGTGWYNIALINTTPSISGASASYNLATDGTATTVTITATDPEGIPITYSIASDTSGNIATVSQGTGSNTNVFTITPTTNTANAGTFSLTFRASDGVNIATAVSSFTLVFSIENSNYTTALITSVGANNAVNNSFDDASTNNHTITANGNVTQNTFSPYRHGGYSTYFDGDGDYLTSNAAATLYGHTGAFTIEAWIFPTVINQYANPIFNYGNSGSTGNDHFNFELSGSGVLQLRWDQAYPVTATAASLTPLFTWSHVAVTRDSSNNVSLWINGVENATGTKSGALPTAGTNRTIIGSQSYSEGMASRSFEGYISDLRVVKGTAVYTSAFTPPDERLSAITNTSLLTCHLPYIADGSTNSHSITVNGNTKTEPVSPFDHDGYSSGSDGGSMYFDGSGDYITVADADSLDMESSDFTIEGWYYPIDNPGGAADGLFTKRANGSVANGIGVYFASSDATPSVLLESSSGGSWSINSAASIAFRLNTWNHFALVRNGTSLKMYINGAEGFSTTMYAGAIPTNTAPFTLGALGADGSYPLSQGSIANFRVVKGTAVYTSAFTPPTAPLTAITNTSLLLNGTDAGIIDKSQSVKTITLNGDVKSSTTQTKYLSSSMYFDGNDYISLPDIAFESADYTVECWAWISAQGGTAGIFSKGSQGGLSSATWSLEFSGNNNYVGLYIYAANSGATIITGSQNLVNSSWNHIAVTRSGNQTKLFVNGSQDGSTHTGNYTVSSGGNFYLGGGFYAPTSRAITGYISDFRITKGLARYTSNFTVPSAALQG